MTYNATKSLSRVDFELSGKGDWIALGFSDDQLMVSCNVSRMHLYIFLILLSPWPSRDVTLGRCVFEILSYLHAYERIMKKFNGQLLTNLYQVGHFTVMNGWGWHFFDTKKVNFSLTFTRRLGYYVHNCKLVYWQNKTHTLVWYSQNDFFVCLFFFLSQGRGKATPKRRGRGG